LALAISWKRVLVTHASGRVTGAGLARSEHGERHAGTVQHASGRLDLLASALVERSGTAHPVQVLNVLGDLVGNDGDLEVHGLDPLHTLGGAEAPRVALVLHVAQQQAGLEGKRDSMSTS
jgi:hypothetical protein